jgi:uroporphyrinogen-III synthase
MILNTRPEFYRNRFHKAFAELGLPILDCPVLRARPSGAVFPDPDAFDAVVLTSQFAPSTFSSQGAWQSKKVYAVGQATAEAARAAGFINVTCTGEDAADMERTLASEPFKMALYASAEDVGEDFSKVFPSKVQRISVYSMMPLADFPSAVVETIKDKGQIIVPLFSRRSAVAAASLLARAQITSANARLHAVGISDDIFAADEGPWQSRVVASSPTLEAMVARTRNAAERIGLISKVKQ